MHHPRLRKAIFLSALLSLLPFLAACSRARLERFENWDGRHLPANGKPVCVHGGLEPEGWRQADGSVQRGRCADLVVFCGRVGTPGEGWYAAEISSRQLINRERCTRSQNDRPECVSVSTYAEGWTAPSWEDRRVHWDDCRHKVVECQRAGTEEEGWYALMPKMETARLLKRAACADILRRDQWRWRR